jgi:hypothetical protein
VEVALPVGVVENICLFNSMGQQIMCQNLVSDLTTLSISNLTSGIYYYRITELNGNLIKADKVLVLH